MAWTDPTTRATGDLISASDWNALLGATGSLMELKLHKHGGGAGAGDDELDGIDHITFDQLAAPGAPGASKHRIYAKTDGKLYQKVGAAGAEAPLASDDELWTAGVI